jgi:hypothetical protein
MPLAPPNSNHGIRTTMSLPGIQGEGGGGFSDTGESALCPMAGESRRSAGGSGSGPIEDGGGVSPLLVNLGRMIFLHRDNERLLDQQRRLRAQIAEAMAYRAREDANRGLAWARLAQLRAQHRAVLAHLRANREMAQDLIDRTAPRRDDRAAS